MQGHKEWGSRKPQNDCYWSWNDEGKENPCASAGQVEKPGKSQRRSSINVNKPSKALAVSLWSFFGLKLPALAMVFIQNDSFELIRYQCDFETTPYIVCTAPQSLMLSNISFSRPRVRALAASSKVKIHVLARCTTALWWKAVGKHEPLWLGRLRRAQELTRLEHEPGLRRPCGHQKQHGGGLVIGWYS